MVAWKSLACAGVNEVGSMELWMGERILRPGIRTSDRTEALIRSKDGGWMAQVFYDWLLTVVDDYGRYDARPKILRTEVFPLLLDVVRDSDVERCLAACATAGLIRLYSVDAKPYLELLDFRQRLRAKHSKWPNPPPSSNDGHCHDNVQTMPTYTTTETSTETETETTTETEAVVPGDDLTLRVKKFIESHRHLPVWSPKEQARCEQAVRLVGWARVEALIDVIRQEKPPPVHPILACVLHRAKEEQQRKSTAKERRKSRDRKFNEDY